MVAPQCGEVIVVITARNAGALAVDFYITQDRFLAQLEKGASILDFGCGSGRFWL